MSAKPPTKGRNLADSARAAICDKSCTYSTFATALAYTIIQTAGWTDGKRCFASQKTIASRCRLGVRSIGKYLKEIEQADGPLILTREKRLGMSDMISYTLREPQQDVLTPSASLADPLSTSCVPPQQDVPTISVGVTGSDQPTTNVDQEIELGLSGDRPLASPELRGDQEGTPAALAPMSASWTPNRIHSGSARKLGLNVHDLADKFRDYYLARPAEVHVAAAWARMFGKWLNRNAPDPKPPKTPEELAEAAEAADLADWKAGRGRWAPKPDEAA